jgi:phosphatidate cytidylyltransferase
MFSAIKRSRGIKDYGKIFPGHGGVLDRFDSALAVAVILLAIESCVDLL